MREVLSEGERLVREKGAGGGTDPRLRMYRLEDGAAGQCYYCSICYDVMSKDTNGT